MSDLIVADAYSDALGYQDSLIAYSATGTIASHTDLLSDTKHGILARRASDGHIFVLNNDGTVEEYTSARVFVQSFASLAPTPGDSSTLIQFAGSHLYLGWSTAAAHNIVKLEKRDPTTLALLSTDTINVFTDFPTAGVNAALQAVSLDESVAYLVATGGGGVGQNQIYQVAVGGGTVTVFTSYGTWNPAGGGTGWIPVQGIPTDPSALRVTVGGAVVVLFTQIIGGTQSNVHIVAFDSGGSQTQDITLSDPSGDGRPFFLGVSLDGLRVWVTGLFDESVPSHFYQYLLSSGALLTSFASQSTQNGDLLIITDVIPPPPPTTPPAVLVNSTPCCDTAGSTTPSAGPVLPPVNIDWIPSCTGGGLVPTVPELTLAELWDY